MYAEVFLYYMWQKLDILVLTITRSRSHKTLTAICYRVVVRVLTSTSTSIPEYFWHFLAIF